MERLLYTTGNIVWKSVKSKTPNPKVALPVSGVNGRFVKIQLNGKGALALAEIIVK